MPDYFALRVGQEPMLPESILKQLQTPGIAPVNKTQSATLAELQTDFLARLTGENEDWQFGKLSMDGI